MTELQVKTKKGSLKKFLAMFLAVCVCMTTFQLNGMFASAENDQPESTVVTPEKAEFKTVSGDKAYEVASGTNLNTAEYLTVSPDKAASREMINWTKSDASPSDASITVSDKGVVTGKKGESATIKITVPGTAIQDSCTVLITEDQKETPMPTQTPGAGTATQTPGAGTATQTPGAGTATQTPGAGTATQTPGAGTATQTPGAGTATQTPGAGTGTATQTPSPTKAPVKVKKITLSTSKLYIVAKKSVTVGVGIEPSDAANKKVDWKSSKTSVATVKNGKITAKKVGSAKITATAKDGSKKKATVAVTVVKKAKKVTSVKLPKTAKVDVKGTVALKTTISPKNATMDSKTLKWTTSDKKVATVANGVVTGKKAGVATITVKAGKKSAKCVVTVTKKGVTAKLQKAKTTVKVKKTFQIKLKGKGDSIVDCKTSNKKVATVTKKGKITGKKAGKADITVITKKGGVATFKVTVKK